MAGREKHPGRALAIGSLGAFMAFLDATIVNIAFPDIRASFPDAGLSGLSWVLNAYNIVFAAFLVPAGRYADVLGRRRLFITGLVTFTVASALCAAAPSAEALVAARVVQALGAATLVPASLGLFLPFYPATKRVQAIAIWAAAGGIAGGIGPCLGGLLVDTASWRVVFLVNVPIGFAAAWLARRMTLETRDAEGRLPDVTAALLLASAIGALVLGIVKGEDWGWTNAEILGSFAAAAILALLFYWRTAQVAASAFASELFRVRSFTIANAATVMFAMAVFGAVFANVLFLTSIWGYSVLEAGLATSPAPLITGLVAGPSGRLVERVGHRSVIAIGGVFYALGMAFFVFVTGPEPAFADHWLPASIVAGVGIGLAYPALSSGALMAVAPERFATASAVNATARQIGAALGVAVAVAILGSIAAGGLAGRFDAAWSVSLGLGLLTAAVAMGLDKHITRERRSGMDYEAIRTGLERGVPLCAHLGLEALDVGPGRAVVRLPDAEHLRNHIGTQHGSGIFAAAEASSGAAVFGAFADQIELFTPLALKGEIVFEAVGRGPLYAEASLADDVSGLLDRAHHEGGVRFSADVDVRDEGAKIVATATFGWLLRPNKQREDWTARATQG